VRPIVHGDNDVHNFADKSVDYCPF
jgi:hypothetical protein